MHFREMLPTPPCSYIPALIAAYIFMLLFHDYPWIACVVPGYVLLESLVCWVGHCLVERDLRRALIRLVVIAIAFLPAGLILAAMLRR